MKYILVPVGNSNSSDDTNFMIPGFILNLISAIVCSLYATEYIPNLHGWARFGACLAIIIVLLILSWLPYIGVVLCLLSAIVWIYLIVSLTKGLSATGFKWTLRVIGSLLILLFESPFVLLHIL